MALTADQISPEPDDDDDDVVVDEEEDDEEDLDPTTMELIGLTDPKLVKQMLGNMQARFKNFEDILADLRCQLGEMHQRDDELLKRMAALNEEIAELHLLESYETTRSGAPGASGDNYADIISNYGTESLSSHISIKGQPTFHK